MKRWVAFAFGACGLYLPLSAGAMACQGSTTVLDDTFSSIDPAWSNLVSNYGKVDNGHLLIDVPPQTPAATYASHSLNQNNTYVDIDACVTFSFVATQDANNTDFGLAFWGADDSNYYTFMVGAAGYYQLEHKVADNRFLSTIPWTASALIKKDLNQTNELEVRTKQNAAELFINGTKIKDIKGTTPAGGGTVGIFYQLPAGGGKIAVTDFILKN